jgi:hypothetical protein
MRPWLVLVLVPILAKILKTSLCPATCMLGDRLLLVKGLQLEAILGSVLPTLLLGGGSPYAVVLKLDGVLKTVRPNRT